MAKDATKVKMGVCDVTYGGTDLGYTKGFVKVNYSAETNEKTVDQEDAPIDEVVTKQTFEVTVPIAQHDLAQLADFFPGASIVTNGVDSKLVLSGASGTQLLSLAQELVVQPIGEDADSRITLHYAVPIPSMEFAFEKENVRVYEVTFRAMKGVNGWVTMGDTAITAV